MVMKNLFSCIIYILVFTISVVAQSTTTKHTIQQGETLYSIARKYKTDIKQLYELNNITDREYKVKMGEVILVPVESGTTTITNNPTQANVTSTSTVTKTNGKHEVKSGETLFRIAKMYNTSPETIKQLNGLSGDGLNLGQVLIVPGSGNITSSSSSTPNVVKQEVKTTTSVKPITEEEKKEVTENKEVFVKEFNNNEASYLDKGMAEWIEDGSNDGGTRFYAMHKTAPTGTILKVRNLMNDKTAYVKIVGKLPETEANRNTLIKVSSATAKYLEAVDPKFLVEISFVNKKI